MKPPWPLFLFGALGVLLAPGAVRAATCGTPTWAQELGFPSGRRVLILHADDAGMFKRGNEAIIHLLENNPYVQSASAMAPCKYFPEFRTWWLDNPDHDLGVHLTLNSEWKQPRWGSVYPPQYVDRLLEDYPSDPTLDEEPLGTWWANAPGQVWLETAAQHQKSSESDVSPSHLDSHMGSMWLLRASYYRNYLSLGRTLGIPSATIKTCKKNINFSGRNILRPKGLFEKILAYWVMRRVRKVQREDEVQNGWPLPRIDYYLRIPSNGSYDATRAGFMDLVADHLPEGVTQFFFHPNYYEQELEQATNKWERRVWDAKLFDDPVLATFFTDQDILFTNWTDIMCRWQCNPGNCAGEPWIKPSRCP